MPKLWDEPMEVSFPALFTFAERSGFPELIDDTDGLRLNADNISYQDGVLSLELLVHYAFQRRFLQQYKRMTKAINIVIENADTGQCHHFNLLDPHKRYAAQAGPNFNSEIENKLPGKKISYCQIPLQIELNNPGWGPHLYIRATLPSYNSNILAFDLSKDVELSSFMNGNSYSLETILEDSSDD